MNTRTDDVSPLISVIIVNWNGCALLPDCLGALSRQTYARREVILVDNGSTDGSTTLVKDRFPDVTLVELGMNKGFTGGNIEGFRASHGELIALLNNDTCADERWLENLIRPMLTDPRVGSCASKLIVHGTHLIDSSGDGVGTAGVGFKRGAGKEATSYTTEEDVFGASAAAALYRREMLDQIGFLDDDFFFNDEDADLNFRAQLAGWSCRFVPAAVVYHKVNVTIGRLSDLHVYYHTRNLEFLWLKNMPLGLMVRFAHHKVVQELATFCYVCLRHSKWGAFFRGKRDAFKLLPTMLRKRHDVQKLKRVSNADLKQALTPIFSHDLLVQKLRVLFRD